MYNLYPLSNGKMSVALVSSSGNNIASVIVASLEELANIVSEVELKTDTVKNLVEESSKGVELKYKIVGERSYFVAMAVREVLWASQPKIMVGIDAHNDFAEMFIVKHA